VTDAEWTATTFTAACPPDGPHGRQSPGGRGRACCGSASLEPASAAGCCNGDLPQSWRRAGDVDHRRTSVDPSGS